MTKAPESAGGITMGDLARWVCAFDFDAVPADVIARAKLLLFDAVVCALAAKEDETVRQARVATEETAGKPQARVIGGHDPMSVLDAVFLNGVLIRVLDLNDFLGAIRTSGHPSDLAAVALAVGDWRRSRGRDVLASLVLGYELYDRLQRLIARDRPFDHVSASALVAPAMAGRLMGLDEAAMAHALALGSTHGLTLGVVRAGQLSAAKALANATVARNAVFATLLAARGLTGPRALYARGKGLGDVLFGGEPAGGLVAPLDGAYALMGAHIKTWPCVATSQALVAAALEARKLAADPDRDIVAVEATMVDRPAVTSQLAQPERMAPDSRETADHSFPFLAAVALLDGAVTPRHFEGEPWNDPRVKGMMARIIFGVDAALSERAPDSFAVRLRVTLRGGENRTVEVLHPPGHVRAQPGFATVSAKFAAMTEGVVAPARRAAVEAAAMKLDTAGTLDGLFAAAAEGEVSSNNGRQAT